MPQGRKQIITKWINNSIMLDKMYEFIRKKINEKMQVYVVSPLIEESEKINATSAIKTAEEYQKKFSNAKIEVFHGKQTSKEKEQIINDFANGNIDILISTTVIEVGINIKNANIIVIRSAERFGLSSLHQLRGRVGRGEEQAYCFIESYATNEIAIERLKTLENTTDGFEIAKKDLELRSSGEIFGERQSGLSDLVLVDLVKHENEIEEVKEYVENSLKENDGRIVNEYMIQDIKNKQKVLEYK